MTHPRDNPVRNALRALDQQRADTLADALRPVALTDDTPTPETWRVVEPDGSVDVLQVQSIGGDVYIIRCDLFGREHVRAASSRCAVERFAGQYLGAAEIRGPGEATTAEQLDALREERNEISAECVKLRARLAAASQQAHDLQEIIAGRTVPPTIREARQHSHVTRGAFVAVLGDGNAHCHARVATGLQRFDVTPQLWIALDATGRPCAWPVVDGGEGREGDGR